VSVTTLDACGAAVDRGGLMVLTGLAVLLAPALGVPGTPRIEAPRVWRHADDPLWPDDFRDWPDYPHVRGLQGWGPHPVFIGLGMGTYSWMAREGDAYSSAMLPRAEWDPALGVIAVNRWYVHLDASVAVAWEYQRGTGRVLCIGSHVSFCGGHDVLYPQRDALVANALRRGTSRRQVYWPGAAWQHARVGPLPRPRAIEPVGPWSVPGPVARSTLDAPWSLGAPHGLATGREPGGIGELWLHPLLVADGLRVLAEEEVTCVESTTSGYVVSRRLRSGDGEWTEQLLPSRIAPEWGYEVCPSSGTAQHVALEITCPLRLQWPMPSDLLHPLRAEVRHEGERWVVVISGSDGQHAMALFINAQSVEVRASDVRPTIGIVSAPGEGIRLLVRASETGSEGLIPTTSDLALMTRAATAESERRRTHHVRVDVGCTDTTRDVDAATITSAVAWATTRLASFVSGVTGRPAGLMAGYASTRPGWGVSRPGYAWYFGRDCCWCIDAMLAGGMFEEAEVALEFLATHADITGKIPHEVTTTGVVHYDAADATPLFLRAVAMYASWTGDLAAVGRWWPAVKAGLAHVVSCDRDGDGLPENDAVGHGWVEMGPLGGGSLTSYVAAIWIDALRLLGPLAITRGDEAFAATVQAVRRRAEGAVEGLRLPQGWLALHRTRAGTLEPTLTALAAVPIALGVRSSAADPSTLDRLASPDYTTPWGVRLLARSDPRYAARGYHTGSVWPLFTGWVALADARVGQIDRALGNIMAVAQNIHGHSKGAFGEVLDGDTGDAAGVCPDQAWSAAAVITPLIHGILGVAPRATTGACSVELRLPVGLQDLTLHGLRIGQTRVDCTWRRDGDVVSAEWLHLSGPPLTVDAGDPATGCRLSAQHPHVMLHS
jgi:glycogen debranching enzyme